MIVRLAGVLAVLLLAGPARAEILVRWDQSRVPERAALGIDSLVIPIEQRDAIQDAARKGYRVFVEVDGGRAGRQTIPPAARGGLVVRGEVSESQIRRWRADLPDSAAPVIVLDERGKWPHVRLNQVTSRDGVLQIASRTAQPWLESNHALVRIAGLPADSSRALSYEWAPNAGQAEAPGLDDYLLAIAEAGSMGASLVLPLDPGFQQGLLRGLPEHRREWQAIRQAMAFESWVVPSQYVPMADVALVARDPWVSYETVNLLARHNVAFSLVSSDRPHADVLPPLVIVVDPPAAQLAAALEVHEARGGEVMRLDEPVVDPNAFALDVRNRLGVARRSVDVWNGITVLLTSWRDATDGAVVVSVVNYAHVPRPVQLRIRGTFALVHLDIPGEEPRLIPFVQRDGATEVVIPSVRAGARLFLTGPASGGHHEGIQGTHREVPDER